MSDLPNHVQQRWGGVIDGLNRSGFTLRMKTPEECAADAKAMDIPKQEQLSYDTRIAHAKEVLRLRRDKKLTLFDACRQVGIGYGNFKKIRRMFNVTLD